MLVERLMAVQIYTLVIGTCNYKFERLIDESFFMETSINPCRKDLLYIQVMEELIPGGAIQ